MRVALDTNVIAYAEGFDDDPRGALAIRIANGLSHHELVLPVQVSAELTRLVTRKFRRDIAEAEAVVKRWQLVCPIHPPSTANTFAAAMELASEHRLQIFDALILAAAEEAKSALLLSEDMQDGFVWRGTTVANPFQATPHPLLADLLRH